MNTTTTAVDAIRRIEHPDGLQNDAGVLLDLNFNLVADQRLEAGFLRLDRVDSRRQRRKRVHAGSLVAAVRRACVPTFVTLMIAPGTAAPVASCVSPLIDPIVWP